ncbi:metal-dependent hydrolase [Patescibacteria group bacterium]|nr:metal-dependent hydrolase [Patescibacteria group bacterium]
MKGSTHAIIGANTVWVLAIFPGFSWNPFLLLAGTIGGLLPDLDASDSKIKHLEIGYGKGKRRVAFKPFYLISWIVSSVFKHRGAFHSILAVILMGWGSFFLFLFLSQWIEFLRHEFWLVLTLGYASHLIADGMTHHGIPLLWPWKGRFHFLPKSFRIKTGAVTERILYVMLLLTLALFVMNSYYFVEYF